MLVVKRMKIVTIIYRRNYNRFIYFCERERIYKKNLYKNNNLLF